MKVSLDKVSLIHTISDKEHYNTIITYMHIYKDEYKGKSKYYWKKEHCTVVKVKLDEKCDLHIAAGITHGNLYVKFEFNAGKLSLSGWEELNLLFVHIFEDGYKTAYEGFRVDYLEIAVDFKDVEFNQINAIDNKVKQFNELYKPEGTNYYGGKHSKRGFIIYDKAKQLEDVENIILNHDLLRVESRLRLPKIKLIDIGKIKNPFLPLRIFNINLNPTKASGKLWEKYKSLIKDNGIDAQTAYLSCSPIERQALDLRIALRKEEWWDPNKVWAQAIKEFSKLTPKGNAFTI